MPNRIFTQTNSANNIALSNHMYLLCLDMLLHVSWNNLLQIYNMFVRHHGGCWNAGRYDNFEVQVEEGRHNLETAQEVDCLLLLQHEAIKQIRASKGSSLSWILYMQVFPTFRLDWPTTIRFYGKSLSSTPFPQPECWQQILEDWHYVDSSS